MGWKEYAQTLWDRYLQTHSDEHRNELVQFYTPLVQRTLPPVTAYLEQQEAIDSERQELSRGEPYNELSCSPGSFLPYVPPETMPYDL